MLGVFWNIFKCFFSDMAEVQEVLIYAQKCLLYRFNSENESAEGEWKARGKGTVKLFEVKGATENDNFVRIRMHDQKNGKLRLNHRSAILFFHCSPSPCCVSLSRRLSCSICSSPGRIATKRRLRKVLVLGMHSYKCKLAQRLNTATRMFSGRH